MGSHDGREDARRHEAAGRLALEAQGLEPAERATFLEQACGEDEALLAAARDLLAGLEAPTGFLSEGPGRRVAELTAGPAAGSAEAPDSLLGRTLGDYRLVDRLGAGGMGVVYEAEQRSLGRRVALKVVAPELLGEEALARFQREARILGRLEHPGIARVHEAGVSADGRPFFAMELVRGLPLTQHADEKRLGVRERLELLARTCEAVGHAHARGVVHRDLKPSNVLVGPAGRPKVLDFGVARETNRVEAEGSDARTRTGQLLGTLRYMSPEQAAGRSVGAPTDVYALGLVGHELLTGALPYDTSEVPLAEALELIREQGSVSFDRLDAVIGGDVTTVLAKSLEKDPARRYPTAAELAEDLWRCLRAEPVLARRPTRAYRLRLFVRRRRALVASLAAVGLALLGATVLSTYWGLEATEARLAAERVAYRASLAAAVRELDEGDRESAGELLSAAPERLRGWEWHWLERRAGFGSASRALEDRLPGLQLAPDGSRVFVAAREDGRPQLLALSLPGLEPEGRWPLDARPVRVPAECLPVAARALVGPFQAADSTEQELHFVDVADGRPLWSAKRCADEKIGSGSADSVVRAFSPAGGLATVGLVHGRGRHGICDLATGSFRFQTLEDGGQLAFSPDGSMLAQADYGFLHVWDAADGQVLWRGPEPRRSLVSAAFSPDGTRLYSGSHAGGGHLRVWDAATGVPLAERSTDGGLHQAWAFSADGKRVAWSAGDGRVQVFDALLEDRLAEVHVPALYGLELALDATRRRLVVAGPDFVQTWDLDAREPARRVSDGSYTYAVDFSPDGALVASGSWDGAVRVRDAATGEPLRTQSVPRLVIGQGTSNRVTGLHHDPRGRFLAAATFDGRVGLFDLRDGRVLAARRIASTAGTTMVRVHPDGKRLVVTRQHSWILDARTLELLHQLERSRDVGAWSHDGRRLLIGSDDFAEILDASSFEPLASLPGPDREHLYWAAWSPDDSLVALSARDGTVRVHRSSDGSLVHELFDRRAGRAFGAIFTPDGKRVLSGADDGAVRSWDVETGRLLVTLPAHDWYVHSLALAPDGRCLATGSGDGTTRLWGVRAPEPRAERPRGAAPAAVLGRPALASAGEAP